MCRTGLQNIFYSDWRHAGCHFVKLREQILSVSPWIRLRFFRSFFSSRLASHQPRDKAIFEAGSSDLPTPGQQSKTDSPCATCGRETRYCVCEFISPIATKTKVVILQHPQEPGVDIGTVPIIKALFPNSLVRTGLSWPNLNSVLGYAASPRRWAVLYVGSVRVENLPPQRELFVVDKKGVPIEDQDSALRELEGIILLDGTWSQAKTLWWRNAWLLKVRRMVVRPSRRSLYDKIRREPRKGCLSTLETCGEALRILEKREDLTAIIARPLEELIQRLAKGSRQRRGGRPRTR